MVFEKNTGIIHEKRLYLFFYKIQIQKRGVEAMRLKYLVKPLNIGSAKLCIFRYIKNCAPL